MDDTRQVDAQDLESLIGLLEFHRRILIWGEMGAGKSTLAMALGPRLARHHGACQILCLDPGTPPFGVPGALSRGVWRDGGFHWGDLQALCSLDANRFRLPLLQAAQRLVGGDAIQAEQGPTLIDPPGVVRGTGAAELLDGLVTGLKVDVVLALHRPSSPSPLAELLNFLPVEVIPYPTAAAASRPTKRERSRCRTRLWDAYLANTTNAVISLEATPLLGTPPSPEVPAAWAGRQAALIDGRGQTVAMGEVVRLLQSRLELKLPSTDPVSVDRGEAPAAILIRNAGRTAAGLMESLPAMASACRQTPPEMAPPGSAAVTASPPITVRVGPAWATLVGGVLGDPLLHLRLRHRKESLLFDLGDAARLSARVAHQVRAVFLSHAHLDHIAGFIWFLRARIGLFGPCRIFGPAHTIERIESFLSAITWDRIEDNGPTFEVSEVHGDRLRRARLQTGRPRVDLPGEAVVGGKLFRGDEYHVEAVICDHKIPSVAYALCFSREINVRKDRLAARGWPPGPWLGRLKRCIAGEAEDDPIELPDGTRQAAGELAKALTFVRPGKRFIYAADMADTAANRRKLIALARGGHTLFCETAFMAADGDRAAATQHLTTTAAVEIARAAGVERLVPFHFSKRYEKGPARLYRELRAQAGRVKIIGRL
jgi:ribonuclease BN (tRNA processing enzyme)